MRRPAAVLLVFLLAAASVDCTRRGKSRPMAAEPEAPRATAAQPEPPPLAPPVPPAKMEGPQRALSQPKPDSQAWRNGDYEVVESDPAFLFLRKGKDLIYAPVTRLAASACSDSGRGRGKCTTFPNGQEVELHDGPFMNKAFAPIFMHPPVPPLSPRGIPQPE